MRVSRLGVCSACLPCVSRRVAWISRAVLCCAEYLLLCAAAMLCYLSRIESCRPCDLSPTWTSDGHACLPALQPVFFSAHTAILLAPYSYSFGAHTAIAAAFGLFRNFSVVLGADCFRYRRLFLFQIRVELPSTASCDLAATDAAVPYS
ncbi:hypothetical protein DFH09DRAFT_356892 [Mycena vulgaris]|nr:hypothetical protein DFH09DRAFT_356892 [Mycena vulgaris]